MNPKLQNRMIKKLLDFCNDLFPYGKVNDFEEDFQFQNLIRPKNRDSSIFRNNKNVLKTNEDIFNQDVEIVVESRKELDFVIALSMLLFGKYCNLNFINVSNIRDFSHLFSYHNTISLTNIDEKDLLFAIKEHGGLKEFKDFTSTKENWLSEKRLTWDFDYYMIRKLSNPNHDIIVCFQRFNGIISFWNLEKAVNTNGMFYLAHFNQHHLKFNLPLLKDAESMFFEAGFSKNFIGLNTKNLVKANYIFYSMCFKGFVSIDLRKVENISHAFTRCVNSKQIEQVIFPKKITKNINVKNFIPLSILTSTKNKSLISFIKTFTTTNILEIFKTANSKCQMKFCPFDTLNTLAQYDCFNNYVKTSILNLIDKRFQAYNSEIDDDINIEQNFPYIQFKSKKELFDIVKSLNNFIPKKVKVFEEKHKAILHENNLFIEKQEVDSKSNKKVVLI